MSLVVKLLDKVAVFLLSCCACVRLEPLGSGDDCEKFMTGSGEENLPVPGANECGVQEEALSGKGNFLPEARRTSRCKECLRADSPGRSARRGGVTIELLWLVEFTVRAERAEADLDWFLIRGDSQFP